MRPPPDALPVVYLDGAYVPATEARVSAFDRGLLVADGIFETFHVLRGVPLALRAHLARLAGSAAFMHLRLPHDEASLARILAGVVVRNGLARPGAPEAALRLTLTRGATVDGPPTVFAYARRLSVGHLAKRTDGVRLHRMPFAGRGDQALARHKTLSYLASSLGQVLLRERTDDPRAEGLFVADTGEVLEGTASNVFIIAGGRLVTAPVASGVLPGTSRSLLLGLARGVGLEPVEEAYTLEALRAADEVLVTASTLHVAPVVALDDAPVGGGRLGPATARLQAAYRRHVEEEIAAAST